VVTPILQRVDALLLFILQSCTKSSQEGVLFTSDEVVSLENLSGRAQTIISQLYTKEQRTTDRHSKLELLTQEEFDCFYLWGDMKEGIGERIMGDSLLPNQK
jgi:hypothetical protein